MFLITAFILVATIAALRISIKIPTIQENMKLIEVTLENDIANNFYNELKNAVRFSINEKSNIGTNVFDFANFTDKKASEHALTFEFLFVGSLASISSNYMDITLINMLNKPINATLTLNSESSSETINAEVTDNAIWNTGFSFDPGSSYNLTVSYNSTYTENITIKTKTTNDVYIGFFDVTLKTPESVHRSKAQETYTLS